MIIEEKLEEILEVLRRIEERQIKTTKMVAEIEQEESPGVQGSFCGSDFGEKK